jgi:hypothetical protein
MTHTDSALFSTFELVRRPVPGVLEHVPLEQIELAPNHRRDAIGHFRLQRRRDHAPRAFARNGSSASASAQTAPTGHSHGIGALYGVPSGGQALTTGPTVLDRAWRCRPTASAGAGGPLHGVVSGGTLTS